MDLAPILKSLKSWTILDILSPKKTAKMEAIRAINRDY